MRYIGGGKDRKNFGLHYIKLGILLFYALWFFIACLTNVVNLMDALNIINTQKFNSGNFLFLKELIFKFDTSFPLLELLFILGVFIQAISSTLFFIAFFAFWKGRNKWKCVNLAFAISMMFWAAFILSEEIFIAYAYEPTHLRLLALELLSLLAFHLLAEAAKE
ncbi:MULTISPECIES: hypothetical protein [Legionella]|uniref:Transmembrane protein n=1 Tax=Legionella maceachernii TaxID=466 RepID=A0A0W0WGP3_9GAMM|nr:hypothetical protein [Legionella maceachernii]KTD31505.1 hypothetical protein Lmac_0253 [Legionella maceachernii]SJZ95056.1 hypothetical protein SAMN02745128_01562 [Legionella maceachernii]SUP03321.1 Uncharacterised protein [Legionella maceachernii]